MAAFWPDAETLETCISVQAASSALSIICRGIDWTTASVELEDDASDWRRRGRLACEIECTIFEYAETAATAEPHTLAALRTYRRG
jgi:hypothetical protein